MPQSGLGLNLAFKESIRELVVEVMKFGPCGRYVGMRCELSQTAKCSIMMSAKQF